MNDTKYYDFVRSRITELRLKANVSERRMSLELGKSGSYIRGITSGSSRPSFDELFNIIEYFEMTPITFFAPMEAPETPYNKLCKRLRELSEADLKKVNTFIDMISKP